MARFGNVLDTYGYILYMGTQAKPIVYKANVYILIKYFTSYSKVLLSQGFFMLKTRSELNICSSNLNSIGNHLADEERLQLEYYCIDLSLLRNILTSFRFKLLDLMFIINSSRADRFAMLHITKAVAVNPVAKSKNGKKNRIIPVALLA